MFMKGCTYIAATASLNNAIKAQNALSGSGIQSRIVSLPPSATRRGCSYGVEMDCSQASAARSVLRHSGVRISQYIDGSIGVGI